jgi:mannosyl-oligosaccharide alpha-1,3-glucosidase
MPRDLLHFDGVMNVPHFEVHNLYGYFYHKVTYSSLRNRYEGKIRPFILSRSFYAGSQKFGFIWTGDNKATWAFLKFSVDMLLSISMCGISACGADVGGFDLNPTEELLRAWFELGVFYPFFRGHSMKETIRREPWLFSKNTLESIKKSITLRYNLLLFWYTKFFEHTVSGVPILKPLWLRFSKLYRELKNKLNGFVVGEEFIIFPYCNVKLRIQLPEIENEIFYDFESGEVINRKDKIEEPNNKEIFLLNETLEDKIIKL